VDSETFGILISSSQIIHIKTATTGFNSCLSFWFDNFLTCVSCTSPPAQALDGDFSDENRSKCRVATAPLIQAVENLTTFASNPEFASVPAQISREVRPHDHVLLVFMHGYYMCY